MSKKLANYSLDELKLIYSLLHNSIESHRQLMDSELLSDLQNHLQNVAKNEGIDVTHHSAWKAWLENDTPYPFEEVPGDIGA